MHVVNGYVCDSEGQIPFLSSTLCLCRRLQHDEPCLRQATPSLGEGKDAEVLDAVEDTEVEAMEEEVEPEEDDDEKDPDGEQDDTRNPLTGLMIDHDLPNIMLMALRDLHYLKMRDYDRTKGERGSRNHDKRRLQALEKQRERLQEKLLSQNEEEDKSDDDMEVNDDRNDDEGNIDVDVEERPLMRLARFFNSLRLLTPILLEIYLHKYRNDRDLRQGKIKLNRDRKNNPPCWLIGRCVFGKTTQRMCKQQYNMVQDAYRFLGVRVVEPLSLDDCVRQLDACMAKLVEDTPSCAGQASHPLSTFVETERQQLIQMLPQLDDQASLIHCKDEHEHAQYLAAIDRLFQRIEGLIKNRKIKNTQLSMYGSCLSDLSLGKGSDVDLSLRLPEMVEIKQNFEQGKVSVQQQQSGIKRNVYKILRLLENHPSGDFVEMVPVTRARVPVVKGTYLRAKNPYTENGSIHFDICFLNDIAVANSNLIRQYSLVDPRIKQLMVLVKRWAKKEKIASAQDNALSSYAWNILVIFYLQCLGFCPNLQDEELMAKVDRPTDDYWGHLNNLDTSFCTWSLASKHWSIPEELSSSMCMASLLYGFFHFYASEFPASLYMVSIRSSQWIPKTLFRKQSIFFTIEDPFETYDSHCPHDLSLPVNEPNQRKILACIKEQEVFLRSHFESILADPSFVDSISSLLKQDVKEEESKGGSRNDKKPGTPEPKSGSTSKRKARSRGKKSAGDNQNASPQPGNTTSPAPAAHVGKQLSNDTHNDREAVSPKKSGKSRNRRGRGGRGGHGGNGGKGGQGGRGKLEPATEQM